MANKYFQRIVKNKAAEAVILNFIFLLFAILFCEQKYEVSDDFIMETILSGAYGDTVNPHMLFVNTLYGYLLLPLYLLFPGISWYLISLIFWGFLACTTITYLLFVNMDQVAASLLSVLFLCFYSDDIYILIQFTKTAVLCLAAGSLFVLYILFHSSNKRMLMWGTLLCIIGSFIRFNAIYIAAPFILLIIICETVFYFQKQKRKFGFIKIQDIRFWKMLLTGTTIVAVLFVLYFIGQKTYITEEYHYYRKYTETRAAIVDSVDYGYEAYAGELQKIGISENDYQMLRSWNFADPEYFTLEKLENIASIIREYNKGQWEGWHAVYEKILNRKYTSYPICIACLLLLLIGLIWNTKYWWGYVSSSFLGIILLVYFYVWGRVLYRVEFGIFLCTFILLLYFSMKSFSNVSKGKDYQKAAFIIMLLCCIQQIPVYLPDTAYKLITIENRKKYLDSVFIESGDYDARKYRKIVNSNDLTSGLVAEMKANPEHVYLLDFNTTMQTLYYDWSAWESLGVGYYKNFCYLSGVTMNFPDVNQCLQNMGIYNPLKDLVNENVYLVDNINLDEILFYLQEHYYPDAKAEWIKNVEGYDIWKITEE